MNNVAVVSAFVPLDVKHLTQDQYQEYGRQLKEACGNRAHFFNPFPFDQCWLANERVPMVPATETPADRYTSAEAHVRSHIVQHNRTEWAKMAAWEDPSIDTIVWLDFAILKQGDFTGKRVTKDHVREFLEKVEKWTPNSIPCPGIEPRKPVNVHGNNRRFCGSTHIWPVKFLGQIDRTYKAKCRQFIYCHGCVPLDLAIWPMVEQDSGLPFRWYQAEYDATQLTNFPG